MNLSKQIKDLRQRDGLSQEALAERIYVSRQTISNWETERSYPDVQSLLLLSVLFNVSIDELVKGDIDMMKEKIDAGKMNAWSVVMLICIIIGALAMYPMFKAFGPVGFIAPGIVLIIGLAASFVVEAYKKKYNIKTYAEIVAFFEGSPLDTEKDAREKKHAKLVVALKLLGGAVAGLILVGIGYLISLLF